MASKKYSPKSFVDAGGADIVILAMPVNNIKPGDRFAIIGKDGKEIETPAVQSFTQVSLEELSGVESSVLEKRYGPPSLVPLFNRLKEIVTTKEVI